MRKCACVLIVPLIAMGCSSSYQPANSPRIALVMDGGAPVLYKNGIQYPIGVSYGGLEDAVKGNPAAEREAATAHRLALAGLIVDGVAIGGIATGAVLAGTSNGVNSRQEQIGAALVAVSLVPAIVALVLVVNAAPHLYDAINIYNDGLPPTPASLPPRLAP